MMPPELAEVIDQAISEDDTLMVSLEVVNVDTGRPLQRLFPLHQIRLVLLQDSSDLTIKAVPAQVGMVKLRLMLLYLMVNLRRQFLLR